MTIITYNKQFVPSDHPCIRFNDRGFTLGHGLFETILIKHGTIPALAYHWRRLEASAPILGIVIPFTFDELHGMILELICKNGLENQDAGARVTITHGESTRGILPALDPEPNFLISVFECPPLDERPFSVLISRIRKNEHSISSRIKSLSYLDNILARKEAMEQKYDEAILLNSASHIADGSISNIYMVKDGQVFTPSIEDGALPGTIRTIFFEKLISIFPIEEKKISINELLNADEIFLTNALMGIKSVNKVNLTEFNCFSTAMKIKQALTDNNFM